MTYSRTHKIRLKLTPAQGRLLTCVAGAKRFVHNWALDENKKMYAEYKEGHGEHPTWPSLCKRYTQWKNSDGPEWLQQLPACAASRAIKDVFNALQNFFRGTAKFPKYHKKGRNDSFYIGNTKGALKQSGSHWYFRCPNVGWIKLSEDPRFSGKIMSYTVSRQGDNWYVSVQYQMEEDPRPTCENPTSAIGIDVGVAHSITCSDGQIYQIADTEKLRRKLKYQQRYLSRSNKKSNNHKKYLRKVRRTVEHIQSKVQDSIHKATTAIVKNHGIVVVEDLNIKGMKEKKHTKSRASRRNIQNACMSEILRQLSYKAQQCFKVDRFFPSSQLCSKCGHQQKMPVQKRLYVCPECGQTIDRDLNAALNMLHEYISGRVTPVVSCG